MNCVFLWMVFSRWGVPVLSGLWTTSNMMSGLLSME